MMQSRSAVPRGRRCVHITPLRRYVRGGRFAPPAETDSTTYCNGSGVWIISSSKQQRGNLMIRSTAITSALLSVSAAVAVTRRIVLR